MARRSRRTTTFPGTTARRPWRDSARPTGAPPAAPPALGSPGCTPSPSWIEIPFLSARALGARLLEWTERAGRTMAPSTAAWVAERVATTKGLDGARVPCHRDFGPRNWLWDPEEGLGVIDFEHARPDARWVDVLRLIDGPWQGRPDLEAAFWDGYGRRPTESDRPAIDALRALHAVGTVVWGARHGDAPFVAEGWGVLERLGAPLR